MKNQFVLRGVVSCLTLAVGLFVVTTASAADCPKIPDVPWWGNTSPQKISAYVKKKHDGDWVPYIKKWERQLQFLQKVDARGGSAIIKSKGITLKDDRLTKYVVQIAQRVGAIRCLADVNDMSGFDTASGRDRTTSPDK